MTPTGSSSERYNSSRRRGHVPLARPRPDRPTTVRIIATSLTPRLCCLTTLCKVQLLRVSKCVVSVRVTRSKGKPERFRQTWVRQV